MSASNAGEKNVRWVNALLAPYLDRRFGGMDKRHREYALPDVSDIPTIELAHPWERGGASRPVQGGLECAHWGTWGPGRVANGIRNCRSYGRSYRRVVRLRPIPFQCFLYETLSLVAPQGVGRYTPSPRFRGLRGVLHF